MAPKRPRPPAKPRNHGERKELEGSVRIGIEGRLGNLFGGRRPRVDAAQGRALPSGSPDLPVRGARLRRNRSRSGGVRDAVPRSACARGFQVERHM